LDAPVSLGLARVTIAAPKRRIDVALPEGVPVSELLPHLLRHAGEGAADDGERHGGWVLRRTTGVLVEPGRNLVLQGIRDGEVLYLVPRRAEWPELAYDDVVEVIARGARRNGRSWGGAATRRCALAVTCTLLGLGVVDVMVSGPPWLWPGIVGLAFALVLAAVGAVLSRAMSDAVAGAVVAACGLPYAAVGGFLVMGPAHTGLSGFGAPHVLLASTALLLVGVICYGGVAALGRLFVAAIAIGLLGVLGGLLYCASITPAGAAAVVLTVAIGLLPGYPLLSAILGRLPVPALPQRPEEMLEDRPVPSRSEVFAAVTRAYEILTGLLLGVAVASACCVALLLASGLVWGAVLSTVAAVALLLRARLFPTPQQRVPLIVSGAVALGALLLAAVQAVPTGARLVLLIFAVGAVAAVVLTAGLVYSRRAPSPYVGRLADIADVAAIMALTPLACGVAGGFGAIQALFASVG
jgi:type VII secretion integral membrane protein EccD